MARIDTSVIEGYAEMTDEQKIAALEGWEYEDNAAEIQRLQNSNNKASKEAAEWKRKYNGLLDEEDRTKNEREEELKNMQKELEDLRREKQISIHEKELLSMGYDNKLANETAIAMADGDTEKFFANQKKFLEAHDKAYKAELMKTPLEPSGGDPPAFKTKEEIMKIKDTSERQQAIANNPELFGLNL